jgi:hypothetical protein
VVDILVRSAPGHAAPPTAGGRDLRLWLSAAKVEGPSPPGTIGKVLAEVSSSRWSSASAIFVAELGDKSQLMA